MRIRCQKRPTDENRAPNPSRIFSEGERLGDCSDFHNGQREMWLGSRR
jgi:hypothetical protein